MTNIAIFKRSDGAEFHAEEGSESFKLMTKDGSFTRIQDGETESRSAAEATSRVAGAETSTAADADVPAAASTDLAKMTKAQLVAEAEACGVTVVPDEMTKAQIIEAIEGRH